MYREIVWRSDYEIGISEIDDQHKKLLDIANKFLKAKSQGLAASILKETFEELIRYTRYHFNAEEENMKKAAYPLASSHEQLHQKLINQIVEVLNHIKEGRVYAIEELTSLIRGWLVDHMINEDKKFGNFLDKKK